MPKGHCWLESAEGVAAAVAAGAGPVAGESDVSGSKGGLLSWFGWEAGSSLHTFLFSWQLSFFDVLSEIPQVVHS